MGIYEKYGIRPVINCQCPLTPLGGGIMPSEVVDAMVEAAKNCVSIRMLDVKCGRIIADICGAEAALITASTTSGLVLSAASCAMRNTEMINYDPWRDAESLRSPDIGKINRLVQRQLYNPSEIEGIRTEVIVPLGHETIYTICMVNGGLRPVWAGDKKRCRPEDIEKLITNKTAAIFLCYEELIHKHPTQIAAHQTDILSGIPPVPLPDGYDMPFQQVLEISKKQDVPVILDAAFSIPPLENLRKFAEMGVGLTSYCGGKSICAPHDVGFTVGQKKLVKLAACHRFPFQGVGRGFKIDKTEMIAMTKALQIYPRTVKDNLRGAKRVAAFLEKELKKLPHVKSVVTKIPEIGVNRSWPVVGVELDEESLEMTMDNVADQLGRGSPPIFVSGPSDKGSRTDFPGEPCIAINCQTLYHGTRKIPGNERIVLKRFKEILTKKR